MRSTTGLLVFAFLGLLVAAGIGTLAFVAYRRSALIAWWQILAVGFGAGLFLNAIGRASGVGPVVGIANLVFLLLLIGGGILSAVEAARKPASAPVGPLTAPLVGYTADGQPVYGSHMQPQATNTFAVLALVFGILGGLLGVVFGHVALSQIKRTGEGGRGLAVAGLVLGYIYLAFWLLMLFGYVMFSISY